MAQRATNEGLHCENFPCRMVPKRELRSQPENGDIRRGCDSDR
jgi:hypothetical protein